MRPTTAIATLLLLSLITLNLQAQSDKAYYAAYDWSATAEKPQYNPADTSADQTLLFEKVSVEYRFEDQTPYQYNLRHTRMLVKTDRAIESNNKVYVNNSPGDLVITQKARVIKPNGSVTTLKKEDIKESLDENGDVQYRYFALDGLEKGCVVEYFQYTRTGARYTGSTMVIQGEEDILKGEYDIISPLHLDFRVQPMNDLQEFELDTLNKNVRRKYLNVTDMKALRDEYSAPYRSLLKKVYYKLDKNFDNQKGDFYNYNNVSKVIFDNMFSVPSKGALKKVKAIVKDMEQYGGTTEDKLRYMEFKIKSEIPVIESNSDQLDDLDFVLEKKVASEIGMTRLFINVLREANIPFELVLTSDRDEMPFVKGYEAYNFLNDYLIYLPALDKYLSSDAVSRLGFPPYENTGNKGLFIQEKTLNELKVPVAKVKDIRLTESKESLDIITSSVDFSKDINKPEIYIEREVSGYKALNPQSILDYLDEEQKTEAKKSVVQYIDESSKLEDITYTNAESAAAGIRPMAVKAKFVDAPFVSRAGETILLKAGMLIGPQAELYNKEKRTLPLFAPFTRQYRRKIEITLPNGYTVKNPEVLKMNNVSGDKLTGFSSDYEMNGNKLTVTVTEHYDKVYYDVAEYQEYESVMNSAADFNKIVLVIEKN